MTSTSTPLPFLKRLSLYLDERFPLPTHGVVVFAFFFSNYLLAFRLIQPGSAPFGWRAIAGMITVLLSLFLLRVFDEFKDYENDLLAHPDRMVSQGIMPLSELKRMGWTVVATLMACNLPWGPWALAAFGLVLAYSYLMFREFFVGAWLKTHPFLYAFTHQIIIPLLCVYVYVLVATVSGAPWHGTFWVQLAMGAATGLGWELSRKVRMPEDERPLIDTYSKHLGPMGASAAAFTVLLLGAGCVLAVGIRLSFAPIAWGLLGLGAVVALVGFVRFWIHPTPKGAKGLSDWAAVLMLLSYVSIAVGAAAGHPWHLAF